ncbi:ribosomal protein L22 [Massarina eburnea CBS 473.64]|uniref:Ribosomal protein L22 n=1 Tax=Massarina eburnea CBS 473.64 TaxID=1395130 RepID=A0A6A6RKN2_9PLEO|nr:ribosomal protein L22 [Massarina eburnea CBS 473.64]
MSARIPTRQLGPSGKPALCALPRGRAPYTLPTYEAPPKQEGNPNPAASQKGVQEEPLPPHLPPRLPPHLSNPTLENYLAKHAPDSRSSRPQSKLGSLPSHPTSLFKWLEPDSPEWRQGTTTPEQSAKLQKELQAREDQLNRQRELEMHALKLDPAPAARRKFETKMAIRDVLKNGRVTKAIKLARTERESVYCSPFLPTSVKKLMRITHLIAGKTVEEALIQLRFSPKRIARDVRKGLMIARDEAIAQRGMGLGGGQAAQDALEAEEAREAELAELEAQDDLEDENSEPYFADGTRRRDRKGGGRLIEMKNGSKKRVWDETEMYIDQAWVGRGDPSKSPEFRARGRINMLTHRLAMFTVVLKEEKTRIRLSDEIQKKRDNRKLWLPMPDRPVTSQRQYCLW